jgi:hypothetical protein
MARVTMVSVGFSAPPVVNWLPSLLNRLATSCVCPQALHTLSLALAPMRQVPGLWVLG